MYVSENTCRVETCMYVSENTCRVETCMYVSEHMQTLVYISKVLYVSGKCGESVSVSILKCDRQAPRKLRCNPLSECSDFPSQKSTVRRMSCIYEDAFLTEMTVFTGSCYIVWIEFFRYSG